MIVKTKKFICSLLVFVMLFVYIPESIIVMADSYNYLTFTYDSNSNGYSVVLKDNYSSLMSNSDLIIPETYDDNEHGSAQVKIADNFGLLQVLHIL